jgi:hypothetical protein
MTFKFGNRTGSALRSNVIDVYVGVDFGTTFSKVSFQIGAKDGTTKYSVRFARRGNEADYCLPSVLGYDKGTRTLVFTQTPEQRGLERVCYFKYSMIEEGVPRDVEDLSGSGEARTSNDPQRLCSAFYLAHLLKDVKKHVRERVPTVAQANGVRWYVNMGVPVSDFNAKPKPIYDEALNVAWELVENGEIEDEMALSDIDRLYTQWMEHSKWSARLNTVPELYAEIIMFLQDKTVDSGFYSVIDIGGGTVDIAVFLKRIDQYKKAPPDIFCVAQTVCPWGYEMYKRVPPNANADRELRVAYAECLEKAKTEHPLEMIKVFDKGGVLIHFYMGGARAVSAYHEIVSNTDEAYKNAWLKYSGAIEMDMMEFMRDKSSLEIKNNPRLVISQMLAQPFEKMPELSGMPWHFKTEEIKNRLSLADRQEFLYGPN